MKLYMWVVGLCLLLAVEGWQKWKYEVEWLADTSIPGSLSVKIKSWQGVWSNVTAPAVNLTSTDELGPGAPRPRTGHSLVLTKYQGSTYIVMFGGRDNNEMTNHVPRTYNIKKVNGTIEFTTYDEKPVNPCNDVEGKFYTDAQKQQAGCKSNVDYSQIQIGVYYNDVWAYRLCDVYNQTGAENPKRYFDTQCEGEGWVNWYSGAPQGGCKIELGTLICDTPSERYEHAAVMYDDGLMYVYGGYSERCADYCDDIWAFDIFMKAWKQVYPAGQLSKLYYEFTTTTESGKIWYSTADVPKDNSTTHWAGPGERWKHVMVIGKVYNETDYATGATKRQNMLVFGGHRLWHGYTTPNQQSNNWDVYDFRKAGGYLDDLWLYYKEIDDTTIRGSTFLKSVGHWRKLQPKKTCFQSPGLSWDSRFDQTCVVIWPTARAGHGGAWDEKRQVLWIFGGYNTYFPYLSTDGPGSGLGGSSLNVGGFVPYPSYDYFLNDLWYYNFTSGFWTELTFPVNMSIPAARTGMVFLLMGDVIFLHGGYADNNYFDDTWYYNITTNTWLQKKRFVHPIYPANCTDDLEYVKTHNCTSLMWPKHLERSDIYPFDILPYYQQKYYWPDPENGPYWNILQKRDDPELAYKGTLTYSDLPPVGTPEFPYAASGPIQFAQKFFYSFNDTHNATLVASCTSVYAEPTRGMKADGYFGRSNGSIFIPQARIRHPNWDGCRDRADERADLPNKLQYVQPVARAGHRAIFYASHNEIIMYGGTGYLKEQPHSIRNTWPTQVLDDMWYFNLYHCINNCSLHGDCFYGFCYCYVGYYGEDCSNISCPGTFCMNDPVTFDQICVHGCHSGYVHTETDVYVPDITKQVCDPLNPGEINGVCDGFGKTYCAPPYIGEDCSIKDCAANCSFNGWCSIEYPVSRCLCTEGYFGDICQYQVCLNNCSYPNGLCNTTTGNCTCLMTYNPYNNSMPYYPWDGDDCSYLWAYSAGKPSSTFIWIQYEELRLVMLAISVSIMLFLFDRVE